MTMQAIPAEIREYLSTNDSLVRAQLAQRYPDLDRTLNAEETRVSVLNWLASNEAWSENMSHFTMNSLKYLRSKASTEAAPVVRAFLLHPSAQVRLAAYEYLLTLYYPDKNREALLQLLQNMLMDRDELIRVEGARYVEQSQTADDLNDFLKRWDQTAAVRGWENTESHELVQRFLKR